MQTILITGGSGFVGRQLTALLQSQGYTVQWLTRKIDPASDIKQYAWDYKQGKIDSEAILTSDAVIHLAGASINAKRWNESYKNEIYESRVKSTEFLFKMVSELPNRIKTFTCSSATGFYGYAPSEKIFDETELPCTDFLSKTCADWEKAASRSPGKLGPEPASLEAGSLFLKIVKPIKRSVSPFSSGLELPLEAVRRLYLGFIQMTCVPFMQKQSMIRLWTEFIMLLHLSS
ncbi:MAG: NAD-dependent epimerase/dehydratase family protein [Flavobacteriaceae bacterium]|nr:NAD-dependent epimerase/dehydratase family protein [Flavobacteriaceae bacterium]